MPLKVSCAKCGGVLHAPDDAGGKKGKCPNCGNILPIPLDAPKVTDSMAGAGGLEGLPATAMVGNPVPRPAEPRGFGSTSAMPAGAAGRVATESKPYGGGSVAAQPNPFSPPEPNRPRPMPHPAPLGSTQPAGRKSWVRARRGLWWVRLGILLYLIAGIFTAVLAAAEPLGIHLPDKDPGYLGIHRLSFTGELFLAAGFAPTLLGLLLVVLGRFGVANTPTTSGARGPALWAAIFTLLALIGLLAVGLMVGQEVRTGSAPDISPSSEVVNGFGRDSRGQVEVLNTQERVKRYLDSTIMRSFDLPGTISRFGLLALILCGVLGESWFLSAIGRVGANLQDRRTCGRATFLCWLGSLLVIVFAFGWLTYAIFGNAELQPLCNKWFALNLGTRTAISAGVLGAIGFIGAVLYIRMLGSARAAIAARIG